jgi:hypothetical protein
MQVGLGPIRQMDQLFSHLMQVIGLGLRFTPNLAQTVLSYPNPGVLALGVAMLAGVSVLIGNSVVLFANRVRPARFVAGLALYAVLFALSLAGEGLTISFVARYLFAVRDPLVMAVLIAFVGSAPLVFGFFIMAATLGPYVDRLLHLWSLLIIVLAVRDAFGLAWWPALVCVVLAQLLIWLINNAFRRPLAAVNDGLWRAVTRADLGMSREAQQRLRTGQMQREMVLQLSQPLWEQPDEQTGQRLAQRRL